MKNSVDRKFQEVELFTEHQKPQEIEENQN